MALDHVIVTGQSLAVGAGVTEASPASQANPANVLALAADGSTTPLVNPSATYQQPARTLAEKVYALTGGGAYKISANTHAQGGKEYAALKKGGSSGVYEQAIAYAQAGYTAAPEPFKVRAVHIIHGEQDQSIGTSRAQYAADVAQWVADFDTDLRAITGQAEPVQGFICQIRQAGATNDQTISNAQADAHRAGAAILVAPKYQFESGVSANADGTHLLAKGYYYLGELHGRAYKQTVIDGVPWEPVLPADYDWSYDTASGVLSLVVTFNVPAAPLVWDTTTVTAKTNYGFDLRDDNGQIPIRSVAITGGDQVTIRLNGRPGPGARLSYGKYANAGNLRDSDPMVSALDGAALHNWCCKFDDALPALASPRVIDKSSVVRLA